MTWALAVLTPEATTVWKLGIEPSNLRPLTADYDGEKNTKAWSSSTKRMLD